MEQSVLATDLVEFVCRNIQSVRQLEVLLLLYSRREKSWSAEEIARALACNETVTNDWLAGFEVRGFLTSLNHGPRTYRFAPSDPESEELLGRLAREYKVRPLKVIDAIIDQPSRKMLNFMDAFRIKKDGGSDG